MKPPPFEFLYNASKMSLQNFRLAELNKANERHKMMREDFEEAVRAEALSLLAEWFEIYGEQLIANRIEKDAADENVERLRKAG